jgi:hypothetical protein
MRTAVTEVDRRLHVLWALKIMKKVGATSLIVKRWDENDEDGMLLFSDVAKEVIAKKSTNVEQSALCENCASQC